MIVLDTSSLIESISDIINKLDSVCCGTIGLVIVVTGIILFLYIKKRKK